MVNITILTTEGCNTCEQVKEILHKLKPEYNFELEEIDVTTEEGKKLAEQHNIRSAPGIIINEELFKVGSVSEEELRNKLDNLD